jgi:hypothetical protein
LKDDDYEVPSDGVVVGRIFLSVKSPVWQPWIWTLAYGYHEDPHPDPPLRGDPQGCDGGVAKCWRRQ